MTQPIGRMISVSTLVPAFAPRLSAQEKTRNSGICHIAVSGRDVKSVLKLKDGRSDMSLNDFLTLVVTAALIVLAAAVHSPFAESLSPVLTSAGAY
jgi:hypothetical protein